MEEPMEQPVDLGSAIKKQLTESFQNMDIVSLLQNIVATEPDDEESEEIREKLQGVLGQYNAMSDEEKEHFTTQMKNMLTSKLSMKLNDHDFKMDGLQEAISQAIFYRLALAAAVVLVILLIIVFFGYKLYKSIMDKKVKREEKMKAKMLKKKK